MLHKLCVNESPSTTAVSTTQNRPQNLCPCFMGVLCIQYNVWNHWQKTFHEVVFVHVSYMKLSWWLHQMEIFSALLALCAGNSLVTSKFPAQRPVTRSFDIFFDLRLNKRLSKKSLGCWCETPSCSLWRHCNYGQCRSLPRHFHFVIHFSCGGVLTVGVA